MQPHPPRRHDRRRSPIRWWAGTVTDKEALVSDLVAIAYPDVSTARRVATRVGEAQKAHLIELDDMTIVEKRDDGKIKLHQPSLAGTGAAGGALWGGLIGLIFFAPLLGMAVGAAAGAAARAASGPRGGGKVMKSPRAPRPTRGA